MMYYSVSISILQNTKPHVRVDPEFIKGVKEDSQRMTAEELVSKYANYETAEDIHQTLRDSQMASRIKHEEKKKNKKPRHHTNLGKITVKRITFYN